MRIKVFQTHAYDVNNRLSLDHIPAEFLSISSSLFSIISINMPHFILSIKFEINYTHHHHISLKSEASSSKVESVDVKTIICLIISNSSGKLQPSSQIDWNDISQSISSSKPKMIIIDNYFIKYNAKILPDSSMIFYRSKSELEQLIKDWISTLDLKIDSVKIPLYYW